MGTGTLTLILFLALILTLLTGLPLAFVLGGVAIILSYIFLGPLSLFMLASNTLGVMQNLILSAIPLFIFMGIVLQQSGIAESLYDVVYKWVGGIKGGLAMGTVIICMFFAAMTGVSGAATVSMGIIALPSMLKNNYQKELVIGSISAGGALGTLIPPSVLMIVYALFAGESVGALFAGGVFSGLLLGGLFLAYIAVICALKPQLGPSIPKDQRPSWGDRIKSLGNVIIPVLLILAVLGTIFGGVATPTEAAAIGALGSLGCAALSRRLTWKVFKESTYQTLRLSCMIVWIIVGGTFFAALYTSIGAVSFLDDLIKSLSVSPYVVLIGIQLSLVFMGMLMDPGAIIMICTPVFVPLIKSLGFDPVWFGVLFIVNMEMAYLTPPFGFNLFYMRAIVPKEIQMIDIYRSVFPFVLLQALCLVLIIIFPQIALWLPSVLIH